MSLLAATTIAKNTFIEALRQPLTLLILGIAAVLMILTTWNTGYSLGYASTESSEVTADTKLLFDIGLSTVFGLGAILAGFIATNAISKEIDNKTILTVVSKPVSRVSVIAGKFLGVSGALSVATLIMLTFLLLAVRHGVMETASDEIDMPVVVFSVIAFALSLGLGAWCNFFYGWNFPQTCISLLLPSMLLALVGTMFVNEDWHAQPLLTDWKPQVVTACLCLFLAVLVLAAIATAASTRLGQVMTIVVCLGIFCASLLSNYLLGRHVFKGEPLAQIQTIAETQLGKDFLADRSPLKVTLLTTPNRPVPPGSTLYFSPSPNGFPLLHDAPEKPFSGSLDDPQQVLGEGVPGAIIATESDGARVTIRNVGGNALPMRRLPESGDYVFLSKPSIRLGTLALWGALPNLQYFWLLDAVSQNHLVPGSYLALMLGYTSVQIIMFLSIAVMLFQKRDVG